MVKLIWHNEHACGELGRFDTEEAAIAAGRDWKAAMIAIDTDPSEAEHVYWWEVINDDGQ